MLPGQFAHLWFIHIAQRETRATELLLGKTKEKVRLVLGAVSSAAQQPAVALRVKLATGVVSRSQQVCSDLAGSEQQLVKLQMVVAQAARDGSASGKIFLHKGTHHVTLKAVLMVDHVIRDVQVFG